MLYNIVVTLVRLFCMFCFRITVKGKENIPLDGGAVVSINHTSYWDPVIIECFMPRKVSFMAKEELEHAFFVGWVLKSIGTIFVKRNVSDFAAVKQSVKCVEAGNLFGIFPTGTRSKKNPNAKPQMGVAFIAAKSKAPVIPVHIISDFKLFSKMTVSIGKPQYVLPQNGEKFTKEDYEKKSIELYDDLLKLN